MCVCVCITQSSIVGEEDLEDRELQESLERARRLAMTSKNNNKNTTTAGSGAGAAGTSDAAGSGAGDMAVDGGDGIAGGGGGVGGGGMSTVEQIARSAAKVREVCVCVGVCLVSVCATFVSKHQQL